MATTASKLSKEEFVTRAIQDACAQVDRNGKPFWGCHTIYTGFDEAFREYFGEDPEPTLLQLEEDGVIRIRDSSDGKGKMVYLAGTFVPRGKAQAFLDRITRHSK